MELGCYLPLLVGSKGEKQRLVWEVNAHPPV